MPEILLPNFDVAPIHDDPVVQMALKTTTESVAKELRDVKTFAETTKVPLKLNYDWDLSILLSILGIIILKLLKEKRKMSELSKEELAAIKEAYDIKATYMNNTFSAKPEAMY